MNKAKSFTVTTRSAAQTVIVGEAAPDKPGKKINRDKPAATGQEGGEIENKN